MVKVEDMTVEETHALLQRIGFGHLGCARDNRPYVLPMHFAYDAEDLYFITTEGMKTDFIAVNPQVCLQVEEVQDPSHWQSVMVNGHAEQVTQTEDMERAMQLITARNPSLTPALNLTQIDAWGRANKLAVYRLHPDVIDGRKTIE